MSVFTKEQQAQLDGLAGSRTAATGRDSTNARVSAFARQFVHRLVRNRRKYRRNQRATFRPMQLPFPPKR